MKLADILAKVAKGDALTDEEKKFVGEYDEQKTLDTAAANARKKAEKEAKDAKDALEKLQGEFDEFKAQNDPAKKQTELDKALNRIAKLERRTRTRTRRSQPTPAPPASALLRRRPESAPQRASLRTPSTCSWTISWRRLTLTTPTR